MKRLLLLFLGAAAIAAAQQPDCIVSFGLSAAGNSFQFDNRTLGCYTWGVSYTATGFSALTFTFQSAPDSGGTPGTWVTFAGTVVTGSNPSTATNQAAASFTGYYPWLRINLAGLTGSGTVTGTFYGWRIRPSSGGGGGPTTDVNLIEVGGASIALGQAPAAASIPVVFASDQQAACSHQAAISLSSSGNTEIVGLSGSTTVQICHISLSAASTVDVTITRGTGTNCGTGTADITGEYQAVTGLALDFGPASPLKGAAGEAVCVELSSAVTVGGVVIYAQD